jgi:SAM-dependent methyltransferase
MRPAEARWIADQLAALPLAQLSPFLNIGSSTAEFREVRQPHIDGLIFAPLRRQGARIVHADLKQEPGVDIAGDLMTPAVQAQLRAVAPRIALSSNLLEHVTAPAAFAQVIGSLLAPGSHLIVTVPRSYPFHADPIDTGFRPTPTELAALFPGYALVRGDVVVDTTYGQELWAQGLAGLRKGVRSALGALRPRGNIGRTQRDRLRWLFRPYSTTCVLLARK